MRAGALHRLFRPDRWRARRRAATGANAGVVSLLIATAVAATFSPAASGAFTATTGGGSSWQTTVIPAPIGLSANRTCPSSGPTLKAVTTLASGSGVASLTVPTPSAAIGDLLLAFVTTNGSNAAQAAGFSNINYAGASGMTLTSMYMKVEAAPAANYTFTFGDGTAGTVVLASYSGVDTTPGFYVPWQAPTQGTGSSATSSTVTPPRAPGRMVVGLAVAAAPSASAPTGLTQRVTVVTTGSVSGTTVWDGAIATTATTPAYVSSWATSRNYLMMPVYLMPPSSSGTTSAVTLTWTAPAQGDGYAIRRNDGPTFSIGSRTTVTLTDDPTVATTAYTYYVKTVLGTWSSTEASVAVGACT